MKRSRAPLALGLMVLAHGATPAPTLAQRYAGYARADTARQAAAEARLVESITPAALDSMATALSAEPHVAGSPAQERTRDYAAALTRGAGLRTETPSFRVYLPWADSSVVEQLAPERRRLVLGEPPVLGDPATAARQYPWANGYSASGDVEGELVYVNYGLEVDYAALDSAGVDVRGRVLIARYGRAYRGVKAALAERHGARALILYSDPRDDGYYRGDVYPEGGWRPGVAAQRGAIQNGEGDPSTPGGPSTADAARLEGAALAAVTPTIPVVPMGHAAAAPLLAALRGAELPAEDWQGGLPFRYHVGPGPTRARVAVYDDRARAPYKTIWNTLAWLPGAERPDEWVLLGGHRDAWGAGADDNVSGTSSVLAAARALAALAESGARPRRTIAFATWDGEEWGLLGSTEWVEANEAALTRSAVAYLNQDAVAGGPRFGASASPSLDAVLRDAARVVPDPGGAGTLLDAWTAQGRDTTAPPPVGHLGGGSDHGPFYQHLGIPSAGWGFGGAGTEYHSAYDTHEWMRRFGDPGFVHHAANARLAAVTALRLANAEVLPFDYVALADEMAKEIDGVAADAAEAGLDSLALQPLRLALERMREDAAEFAVVRESWLGRAGRDEAAADSANARLMRVERSLARDRGIEGEPWTRNLMFSADPRNGYATLAFPSIVAALRSGSAADWTEEIRDVAVRVGSAAMNVRAAAEALRRDDG